MRLLDKLVVLTMVFLSLFSCAQQQKNRENKLAKAENMLYKKEVIYGISLQIDIPFELYVNDIVIAKEYSKSRKNMGIDINPYLLKNGTYTVKIRLLPLEDNNEMVVRPKDVATSFVKLVRYELQREPMMGRAKNYKVLEELPLPQIDTVVPILETEWEIEITELPYEIKGWSNSQDLSKMNRDELEKEVKDFYVMLRDELNSGNPEVYFDYAKQRSLETITFNYTDKDKMQQSISDNINRYKQKAKGTMYPIENYKLFIYGNGKLCKLERIDEANLGRNCLIRKNGKVKTWISSMLHKPIGSDTFEIIRK
ncbi:hypothetical protein M601_003030 [Cellulophaga baltica 4]|nr:hypothetical protein M601_003030 [Cellulophaga baltica 4]